MCEQGEGEAAAEIKTLEEIDQAEQQAKADTNAMFERVMGRPN